MICHAGLAAFSLIIHMTVIDQHLAVATLKLCPNLRYIVTTKSLKQLTAVMRTVVIKVLIHSAGVNWRMLETVGLACWIMHMKLHRGTRRALVTTAVGTTLTTSSVRLTDRHQSTEAFLDSISTTRTTRECRQNFHTVKLFCRRSWIMHTLHLIGW